MAKRSSVKQTQQLKKGAIDQLKSKIFGQGILGTALNDTATKNNIQDPTVNALQVQQQEMSRNDATLNRIESIVVNISDNIYNIAGVLNAQLTSMKESQRIQAEMRSRDLAAQEESIAEAQAAVSKPSTALEPYKPKEDKKDQSVVASKKAIIGILKKFAFVAGSFTATLLATTPFLNDDKEEPPKPEEDKTKESSTEFKIISPEEQGLISEPATAATVSPQNTTSQPQQLIKEPTVIPPVNIQNNYQQSMVQGGRGTIIPPTASQMTVSTPEPTVAPSLPTISSSEPTSKEISTTEVKKPSSLESVVKVQNSSVNLSGLNNNFKQRFGMMAEEFLQVTGKPILVTSGFRDPKQQEELYKKIGPPKAAPPGKSRHNSGIAIDINSPDANKAESLGLLSKYGFHRPLLNIGEPWHVEPVETAGKKALPDNPFQPGEAIAVAGQGGKPVTPSTGETLAVKEIAPSLSSTETTTAPSYQEPEATKVASAVPSLSATQSYTPSEQQTPEQQLADGFGSVSVSNTPDMAATPPRIQAEATPIPSAPMTGKEISKTTLQVAEASEFKPISSQNIMGVATQSGDSNVQSPSSMPSPIADRGSLDYGTMFDSGVVA